jgi:hypothetical protein
VGANQVGRNHAGLRKRMALFARLRSASRALPAATREIAAAEREELRASRLRETLSELAAREAPAKSLAADLNARLGDIDLELGEMQGAVLTRFDDIPFVSLRAAIPRSVETHRREVVALLEVLLAERETLVDRLPRVEYLITMLSTEESEGRRNIVHDPVTLTPVLEKFADDSLATAEADAIAMELYQAAALDSDSENFHEILRSLRARKQNIGLGCLCPAVLRAVVTYNARMFNSVESMAEASRTSDAMLDQELEKLEETIDSLDDCEADEFVAVDEVVAAADAEDGEPEAADDLEDGRDFSSVFESESLDSIIEALRIRAQGGQVGRRGPHERIAVVLDHGSLEAVESAAILSETPDATQRLVALTTVVGLMLRDPGPLKEFLEALEIPWKALSDDWVRELNDSFGRLISKMLADPKSYDLTSQLSGIKTKHLLKPFRALNAGQRSSVSEGFGGGDASAEMARIARDAANDHSSARVVMRSAQTNGTGIGFALAGSRLKVIAAAALVTIAIGLTLSNVIDIMPSEVRTVKEGALRITSPHLKSAYRNGKGRGGLMIGRVDALFVDLPIDEKIEAAEEMVENFEIQGIREAMFYDARGTMHVHYMNGKLNRPRPGDRSTGHAPGEAAVRRTLSGQKLDEVQSKRDDDEWSRDF